MNEFKPADGWDWDRDYRTATLHRTTEHGVFRARITREDDPTEPEFDGGCPILRVDGRRVEDVGYGADSRAHDGIRRDVADVLETFVSDRGTWDGIDTFGRWLAIFHGGRIVTRTPDNYSDHTYVAYTTPAMVERWGSVDRDAAMVPEMAEWEYYLEGDVFGIAVDRAVAFDRDGEPAGWEPLPDTEVWGHYGETWAMQAAEEELESELRIVADNPPPRRFLDRSPLPRNVTEDGSRFWVVTDPPATVPAPWGADTAGVVDDNEGGIILYTHKDRADRIVDALRQFTREV